MDVPLGAERTQSAAYATPAASNDGLGKEKGSQPGRNRAWHTKIARATGGKKHQPEMFAEKHPFFRSLFSDATTIRET
jgi:hypothetical protein